MQRRIIDTDQHLIEPPDFWTSRMAARWQDVAPRVVDYPSGGQAWAFEGGVWLRPFGLESAAGRAPSDLDTWGNSFENMNPSSYNAKARLRDMDVDGVERAILYPSVAMSASSIQDDELYLECFRTYNDALWEWSREDPERLIPVAIMPSIGVETAMQELERVAKMGFKTYMFNAWPSGAPNPGPADEPFWSLCEETGVVVSLHGGGGGRVQRSPGAIAGDRGVKMGTTIKRWAQESTNDNRASGLGTAKPAGLFVLTGIMARHPGLRIALVESGCGWFPFFEEQMDRVYTHQRWIGRSDLRKSPSEYFRAQARGTIQLDGAAITYKDMIGADRIMFSTDFPHATCDWPNSRQWTHFILKGVPDEEQEMILGGNALEWYGIN